MLPEQKTRIYNILEQYYDVVVNLSCTVEVLEQRYPIAILNEVRAIMNHLSKCAIADETLEDDNLSLSQDEIVKARKYIDDNITMAESHLKRAILDGFKYLCVAYNDIYDEFDYRFRKVDLSVVHDGHFLIELSGKYSNAKKALLEAKEKEYDPKARNLDVVYSAYEKAFHCYSEVNDLIDGSYATLESVRRKAILKNWSTSFVAFITVVSFVLAIIFYLFPRG